MSNSSLTELRYDVEYGAYVLHFERPIFFVRSSNSFSYPSCQDLVLYYKHLTRCNLFSTYSLEDNQIGNKGCEYLANGLKSNTSFTRLG